MVDQMYLQLRDIQNHVGGPELVYKHNFEKGKTPQSGNPGITKNTPKHKETNSVACGLLLDFRARQADTKHRRGNLAPADIFDRLLC
eukprot:2705656-Amphidinium_carterae.1